MKKIKIVDADTGELIKEKDAFEIYGKCKYCGQMIMINQIGKTVTTRELEEIATELCKCQDARDARERKFQTNEMKKIIEEMAEYVTLRVPGDKEYLMHLMKASAEGVYAETMKKVQFEYDGYKIGIQKAGMKIKFTCKQTNIKNMEA